MDVQEQLLNNNKLIKAVENISGYGELMVTQAPAVEECDSSPILKVRTKRIVIGCPISSDCPQLPCVPKIQAKPYWNFLQMEIKYGSQVALFSTGIKLDCQAECMIKFSQLDDQNDIIAQISDKVFLNGMIPLRVFKNCNGFDVNSQMDIKSLVDNDVYGITFKPLDGQNTILLTDTALWEDMKNQCLAQKSAIQQVVQKITESSEQYIKAYTADQANILNAKELNEQNSQLLEKIEKYNSDLNVQGSELINSLTQKEKQLNDQYDEALLQLDIKISEQKALIKQTQEQESDLFTNSNIQISKDNWQRLYDLCYKSRDLMLELWNAVSNSNPTESKEIMNRVPGLSQISKKSRLHKVSNQGILEFLNFQSYNFEVQFASNSQKFSSQVKASDLYVHNSNHKALEFDAIQRQDKSSQSSLNKFLDNVIDNNVINGQSKTFLSFRLVKNCDDIKINQFFEVYSFNNKWDIYKLKISQGLLRWGMSFIFVDDNKYFKTFQEFCKADKENIKKAQLELYDQVVAQQKLIQNNSQKQIESVQALNQQRAQINSQIDILQKQIVTSEQERFEKIQTEKEILQKQFDEDKLHSELQQAQTELEAVNAKLYTFAAEQQNGNPDLQALSDETDQHIESLLKLVDGSNNKQSCCKCCNQ